MPVNVAWDNNHKTIIRVENAGKWTWDEFHNSFQPIADLLASVNHRVDIITIDKPDALMPSGSPLPHFQRAANLFAQDAGLNITVATTPLTRVTMATFTKMSGAAIPSNFKTAESLDEAYAMIAADRAGKR